MVLRSISMHNIDCRDRIIFSKETMGLRLDTEGACQGPSVTRSDRAVKNGHGSFLTMFHRSAQSGFNRNL